MYKCILTQTRTPTVSTTHPHRPGPLRAHSLTPTQPTAPPPFPHAPSSPTQEDTTRFRPLRWLMKMMVQKFGFARPRENKHTHTYAHTYSHTCLLTDLLTNLQTHISTHTPIHTYILTNIHTYALAAPHHLITVAPAPIGFLIHIDMRISAIPARFRAASAR